MRLPRSPRTRAWLPVGIALVLAGCAPPATAAHPDARPARPSAVTVRDDLRSVFAAAGVTGTFALRDGPGGPLTVVDRARAELPIPPESTFKIAHGLLALDSGTVTDADHQILPYGGGHQPFPDWEHDMSLRRAVVTSNVAVFVQLARRMGRDREQRWLDRLHYGNRRIGDRPDRFWLGGPLRISPIEQTEFLAELATRRLPVSRAVQDTVEDIIRNPTTPQLYAKSGWKFYVPAPQIGWWVGYVRRPNRAPTSFALVIDMAGEPDTPKREAVARALLARLGVL